MAVFLHHPKCFAKFRNRNSGVCSRTYEVIETYCEPPPEFLVQCMGCCVAYLVFNRQYFYDPRRDTPEGVYFFHENQTQVLNYVYCFVKVPSGGGVNAQIATTPDMNLDYQNEPMLQGARPFASGRTCFYQLYCENPEAFLLLADQ